MASSSSSSLPLPSTHHQNQYTFEVFLSFRGEDTRCNFTDHLYAALDRRGIRTFRDNEELNRGEDISQELLKAIEESRVSIIIFSPNYASSRWCLDELVHILECRRSKGQKVRSVFYKVEPSHVRKQTGAFGNGFAKLDQYKYKDKICKWKEALEEAADLSGWPYKDGKSEVKFINGIVTELSTKVVNPSCMLHVADHPVGLESCSKAVNRLLNLEENVKVRMIGIWGAGGIGKTTTAKHVFNSIRHMFDGSCFLADVRSNSNGLAKLQETLLSDVLGDSTLKVSSVDQGVGLIKTRMQRKKVLIILDDVSDYASQLKKLVPSHDCFGRGSRILITTRDKGCLKEADEQYEVKVLDDCHAMKLFSKTAFREDQPPSDHRELTQRAIRYAQGLPLALILLGSHLYCRGREEFEATIGSRRGEPHTRIQDILKLSYDALGDDNLKDIFLDIACFFKGRFVDDVTPILRACYDRSGIEQLQERALLRIDRDRIWKKDMIWMHDLIEEMGKNIANPEGKPDESTRLWRYDDVERALSDNIYLPNLKYMDLSSCEFLRELPDLSGIPNLIELRLFKCKSLAEIHHSIGSLDKLEILDLDCTGLQEFPKIIGKLDSLRELSLSDTGVKWGIDDEKQLWLDLTTLSLRNLELLNLNGCSELVTFPARKASISPDDDSGSLLLPKLRQFNLWGCNLSSADFIGDLDCLETLNNLVLPFNDFVTLPALGKFVNLSKISLNECKRLREIPVLPPNILEVDAAGCKSLERFSMVPKSLNTVQMNLETCDRFSECLGNDMKMMENIFVNNQDSRFSLSFPSLGCEVPKWFQYCSKEVITTGTGYGRSRSTCAVSFEIPSKLELENIAGVAICSVGFERVWFDLRADLSINWVHIHQYSYEFGLLFLLSDHMWVSYIPLSDEIKGKLLGQWPYKCRVEFKSNGMKSCGVHLVCHHQLEQQDKLLAMIPSKRHCTEDELSMAPIDGS